jgi:hypothetical protein
MLAGDQALPAAAAAATAVALLLGPGLAPPGSQLSGAKALLRGQVLLSCCAQGASCSPLSTRPPSPAAPSPPAAFALVLVVEGAAAAEAADAGRVSSPRAAATRPPQAVQRALLLSRRLTELVLLRRSWAAAWTAAGCPMGSSSR